MKSGEIAGMELAVATTGDGAPEDAIPDCDARVEIVTADERRRALEAAVDPETGANLEPLVIASIGAAAIAPVAERYPCEATALMALIKGEAPSKPFAVRLLCAASVRIAETATTGTRAARITLLRAVGAFVMNDTVTQAALRGRDAHAKPSLDE